MNIDHEMYKLLATIEYAENLIDKHINYLLVDLRKSKDLHAWRKKILVDYIAIDLLDEASAESFNIIEREISKCLDKAHTDTIKHAARVLMFTAIRRSVEQAIEHVIK